MSSNWSVNDLLMVDGWSSIVDWSLVSGVVEGWWWGWRIAQGSWIKRWEWMVGNFWLVMNSQWKVAWTGL